eukprot:6180183-Pleurochrysis_carterae.AAC.1
MSPGCGLTAANPLCIHFISDGFPVTGFSLLHACISNASLLPRFVSQSEAQLSCILISRRSENTASLSAVYEESGISQDWAAIRAAGNTLKLQDGRTLHLNLTLAADKKGAEANRGCGPCPVWCRCSRPQQHQLPWLREDPPPNTFAELCLALSRVCGGCLTRAEILELAHSEPGARCRACRRVPYPTAAMHAAAKSELVRLAGSSVKADERRYSTLRRDYAAMHSGQREFVLPPLEFDMDHMIPELLHADSLNIAKLMFKHLVLRHADSFCRERLSTFFAGMKRPIDLRKKDDGRHRAEKWWRASTWDGMVQGTPTIPGGISAWLPTVCFIVIESHLEARRAASRTGKYSSEVDNLRKHDAEQQQQQSRGAAGAARAGTSAEPGGYTLERDSDDDCGPEEAGGEDEDDGDRDRLYNDMEPELGISLTSAIL